MNRHTSRLLVSLLLLAGLLGWTAAPLAAPASFRFDSRTYTSPFAPERGAPLSLTASDGTGLRLVALEADGVLEGPLAFTELRLVFENPRPETMEGRFRIVLPPGAALSRFAMKIGAHWQEGEVVERQRARRIYEDFLHRRQDPALLEQAGGNEFSARVFPIPANGVKELVVSYSHALEGGGEPYRIPLLGLPEIDRLDVRVLLGERPAGGAASNLGGTASDRRMIELHETRFQPTEDFEVAQDASAGRGLRDGNLVVVRVAPEIAEESREIDGLVVLVDSSASRALGYERQVGLVERLLGGLAAGAGGATPVAVAAFDQGVAKIYEGPVSGFGAVHARELFEHGALGASDLEGALQWLDAHLRQAPKGRFPRVLLVSDGIRTAGAEDDAPLADALAALGKRGVERLDAVAVGGLRDEAALKRLVTGRLEQDGQLIDGSASLEEIARRLTRASRSGIEVTVDGAKWVWPQVLDGVQPGDERLIYADLPAGKPVRVALAGRPVGLGGPPLGTTARPLLERAWVKSRIDRLLHLRETQFAGDPDLRGALATEVAELSVNHRVLSPFTAFLVLETENDYRRYQLDRTSLADILTVGPGGLEVLQRAARPVPRPAPLPMKTGPTPPQSPTVRPTFDDDVGDPRPADPPREADQVLMFSPEVSVAEPAPEGIEDEESLRQVASRETEPLRGASPRLEPARQEAAARASRIPPGSRPAPPPPSAIVEESRYVVGEDSVAPQPRPNPWTGRYAEIRRHLESGRFREAVRLAEAWTAEAPGDVLALVAFGEASAAVHDFRRAARAYGSLIDLFPSRADLRRFAGERLEALAEGDGPALAVDTYTKAVAERPDHPSGHRLLAWALVRAGRFEEAFAALESGLGRSYPAGRFAGVERILRDDLRLIATAWRRAEPARRDEIDRRLSALGLRFDEKPSLRFVLTWETDANDVDLHVYDRKGGHAFYSNKTLESGGELYADVTTGYGPECFTIEGPASKRAHPYRLEAHYYSRGPMGYGMGTLQIVEHDGRGGLEIEARPFVVMTDGAYVDLGER